MKQRSNSDELSTKQIEKELGNFEAKESVCEEIYQKLSSGMLKEANKQVMDFIAIKRRMSNSFSPSKKQISKFQE